MFFLVFYKLEIEKFGNKFTTVIFVKNIVESPYRKACWLFFRQKP